MVDKIQGGGGGLTPSDKNELKHDYKDAASKFQAALDKYKELDNPGQKAECKKVMHEEMVLMNQVAVDLHKQALLKQTSKLDADLKALDNDPTATAKLQADLNKVNHKSN